MAKNIDLEIDNSSPVARAFEIIPGAAAWLFLLSPILLSLIEPVWVAYIIIAYDLLWLSKAFGLSYRLVWGYRRLRRTIQINWQHRLGDLNNPARAIARIDKRLQNGRIPISTAQTLRQYRQQLQDVSSSGVEIINPDELIQVVIIALYNESLDILEPTVKSLINANYNQKQIWLFVAYEERGGKDTAKNAKYLIDTYGAKFGHAQAVMHPSGIEGEIKGKGSNITYTGRRVASLAKQKNILPENVIVTTLDSDNRPHQNYFAYLSFIYATTPERIHNSYQPVPMFYNNIWDVPAPMRIIASSNTFWMIMEMMRPHRLRNFSSHAQSLQTLIDTDFWSVKTIVEDGHQYWRTYYRYDGNHKVIPLYMPVYQDAVLAKGYLRTFKAQFIQLRRWAWGVSDVQYVWQQNRNHPNINWLDKNIKFLRLFEGHFSWATAPLVLMFAAWLPLLLNPNFSDQVLAHQLPVIASRIQLVAMFGVIITILISLISLPPRPKHYKPHRSLFMIVQWFLLPVTSILFTSFAALNAQTRLMLGRYLEQFDVTEKVIK